MRRQGRCKAFAVTMSSLFFDYPCKGGEGTEKAAVATDLAWCKSENLLACALDSGRVAIYQDEVRHAPARAYPCGCVCVVNFQAWYSISEELKVG